MQITSPPDHGDSTQSKALSRRSILRRGVGLAAAGVVGGTLLTEVRAAPASAATTSETGALAPAVISLTDGATIGLDASLGNVFRVTIGGNRAMANPINAVDGQKIVIQITQGLGGPYTVSWGTGYSFSTGLPLPTLSTTGGQTDLLAFVYNLAIGKWLFVAFVPGFNATTTVIQPGTYRLFPATAGPSTPVSYSGSFLCGVLFEVTTGGTWLDGYWWWVCPSGQPTAAQWFALWSVYNGGIGTSLVAAGSVQSGPLTAGQWNWVPLPAPVPLAIGACYNVATGLTGSFPDTNGQFGAGGIYSAGIVNGPLSAFSDQSGTLPAPFSMPQCVYSVAGSDPRAIMPAQGSSSSNLWMDLQVDTKPPAGTSYRLWPSYPTLPGAANVETTGYTLANEFQLSRSATLDKIWFYSATGAAALPTKCAIWSTSTQSVVAGTENDAPAWVTPAGSGATAGSGWVACPYTGVTLPAGDYKVAVYYAGGAKWFQATNGYWGTSGPGNNGITSGPLTAPGLTSATGPGQSTYNPGTWAYPLTYGSGGNGTNFWVDVEVS